MTSKSDPLIILKEIDKEKDIPSQNECCQEIFLTMNILCTPLGSILFLVFFSKHLSFARILLFLAHIAITILSILSIYYSVTTCEDYCDVFVGLGIAGLVPLGAFGGSLLVGLTICMRRSKCPELMNLYYLTLL